MSTLEAQIKAVADEAFDQTEPAVQPSNGAERNVWIDIEPVDLDTRRWAARPRRILAVVAAVLLVALVGGLLLATNPNSDPIPADDPNGLSVVELLSGLPLEIETQVDLVEGELIVGGVDLVALENVAGIERPGTVSGPWVELALGAEGAPVPQSALWSSGLSNPEAFEAELPFSALDVGRYVTVNVSGGGLIDGFDQFTLISEVDAVEAAVGEDNLLQVGEGEAGERRIKDRTTLRPIGRPLFVGLDPERDAVAVEPSAGVTITTVGATLSTATAVVNVDDGFEFSALPARSCTDVNARTCTRSFPGNSVSGVIVNVVPDSEYVAVTNGSDVMSIRRTVTVVAFTVVGFGGSLNSTTIEVFTGTSTAPFTGRNDVTPGRCVSVKPPRVGSSSAPVTSISAIHTNGWKSSCVDVRRIRATPATPAPVPIGTTAS